jgi:hypothetical protein
MTTNLTGFTIAATYPQLLHMDGGPEATEKTVYSGTGTPTVLKLSTVTASIENIRLNGNTISTLDVNGNLVLSPNGTGAVSIANVLVSGGQITGITDLAVADGGTGASTAANARTNLGLGTIATQAASAVNITGGTISGVTITGSYSGITLVSSVTLTGGNLQLAGNILSSVNTDGDITLQPNGVGNIVMGLLNVSANNIVGTFTNGDINITPNGTGIVKVPALRSTGSLGYGTGAGGAVTQITSKSTGVTLDKLSGEITTHNESMASNTVKNFVVTNSLVEVGDVPVICMKSGGTVGEYLIGIDAVAAGSFNVQIYNQGAGALAEALVLNFVVIKGVAA